ncbi:GNAT family N-acetyltransferase [Actinomyces trachealis]|uniref:GNAT family N-acetyltransferase n=1 Tax=Actinomyces trachealis TaxID=2763540 RepID=UPI001FD4B7A2|nr:N-acetyltransferase [Actinomyces trachealis]
MTETIRQAGPVDLLPLASLLTEVFSADPLMQAITGPAPDPLAALRHLLDFELTGHYLSPKAPTTVDVVTDHTGRILAAALWDNPIRVGAKPAGPLGIGGEPGSVPAGIDHAIMGPAWDLCLLDGRLCETVRPLAPHWHLQMIAVAPSLQGLGLGSRLLTHGLARADAEALPAHLESTTPKSKRLYERHGFQEVAELGPCDPLPRYWALIRPASPAP